MDITSLCTVIPNHEGLLALKYFLTNALTNNLAPKRIFASLNSFSHLTAFRSRVTITNKLTESLWALKWDLVMLIFLSASSNNNCSTNLTAQNRNFTAATSIVAFAQHLAADKSLTISLSGFKVHLGSTRMFYCCFRY